MVRPKVDKRLQNIEAGITGIMDKLCEISPCETKEDEVVDESVGEE